MRQVKVAERHELRRGRPQGRWVFRPTPAYATFDFLDITGSLEPRYDSQAAANELMSMTKR